MSDIEELKKQLDYERKMNVKIAKESVEVNGRLKQTLEKIEEEMKIVNKCEYCADWANGYCRGFNECTCDCFKRISNIIKECKE